MLVINEKVKDWLLIICGVLLIVGGIDLSLTHSALDKEKALRKADSESYKKAQAEYTAKAIAEKARVEKENEEKSKQADANYADLRSKYDAALLRYAASQRQSSKPNLSVSASPSEGSNGPGAGTELSSELITIPFSDAQICAVNTARLKAIHDWASSLQENKNASEEGVVESDDQ